MTPIITRLVVQRLIEKALSRFFSSRYCSRTPVLRLLYMFSSSHVNVPSSMARSPPAVTGLRYAEGVTRPSCFGSSVIAHSLFGFSSEEYLTVPDLNSPQVLGETVQNHHVA